MSQPAAAARFAVGLASVKRYLRQWRTTRVLAPRPHPGRPRAIPPAAHDRLVALRHFPLISRKQERLLAKRDVFERRVSKIVEYPRPKV